MNAADPDPHNHLFVCFPGGITCAGTVFPLNVNVSGVALLSIAVYPTSANIMPGRTQQFIAIGLFSDGTTSDITSSVIWHSSNPSVAIISSTGLATGLTAGTSLITATLDTVTSSSALLTVTPVVLQSISITPISSTIKVGNTQQYVAIGFFSDGTILDISTSVIWNSSDPATAIISNTGLAQGVNVGLTSITASSGAITSNTANLAVVAFIYVTNEVAGNNTVTYCPVNADGSLGLCLITGNGLIQPAFIALNNTNTIAYVANSSAGSISLCPINEDGSFGTCSPTGTIFAPPMFGLALNPANTFAYLSEYNIGTVRKCTINADGTFGVCSLAAPGFQNPLGIAFNSSGTKAYIANNGIIGASISLCNISGGGTLFGCTLIGNGINGPQGIVLNNTNTFAWITTAGGTVFYCPVNPDGTFGTCADTNAANLFIDPVGIALNFTNTIAYIANFTASTLSECPINSNGTFGICTTTAGPPAGFAGPFGVAINR